MSNGPYAADHAGTVHRTRIPMYPATNNTDVLNPMYESMRRHMIEALVSLYRQSQRAEEHGQAYAFYIPRPETAEIEIGFLRSDDPGPAAAAALLGGSIRKLTDDDVMQLFVQA